MGYVGRGGEIVARHILRWTGVADAHFPVQPESATRKQCSPNAPRTPPKPAVTFSVSAAAENQKMSYCYTIKMLREIHRYLCLRNDFQNWCLKETVFEEQLISEG